MIVDSLVIAGPNRFRPGHELHDVIAAAVAVGVEGLVAAPGRPPGYHLGPANDDLADAARAASLPVARLGRVDPLGGPRRVCRGAALPRRASAAPGSSCTPARRRIRSARRRL